MTRRNSLDCGSDVISVNRRLRLSLGAPCAARRNPSVLFRRFDPFRDERWSRLARCRSGCWQTRGMAFGENIGKRSKVGLKVTCAPGSGRPRRSCRSRSCDQLGSSWLLANRMRFVGVEEGREVRLAAVGHPAGVLPVPVHHRDRQRRGDDQAVLQEGEVLGLLLFGLGKRRPEDDLGPIAGVERPAVVPDAVGEPGHVAGAEKAIDTTTRSCVAGCYCRGIPLPSVAQSPHRTSLRLQGGPPRCRLLAARPAQLLLESLSQEDLE